ADRPRAADPSSCSTTARRRRGRRPGVPSQDRRHPCAERRTPPVSPRVRATPRRDMADIKPRSREVTDGMARAQARSELPALGLTDADWGKAQVGVASSWNEVTPCNMPLDRLAKRAKEGVRDAGGFPIEFVTIAVSDGISMGHEGMRGSLVSREIIADSV